MTDTARAHGEVRNRVLSIVGATATGKTSLALRVAETLPAEIVNADALQVYRGLEIGTAKPTRAERAAVPHHLIDILAPTEPFSAGEFARRARPVIQDIWSRGRLPIVVGGSGFYVAALFDGLAEIPPTPIELRAALKRRLESEGLPVLREELSRLDPALHVQLASGDTQRILRGLEVVLSTGRALTDWWRESSSQALSCERADVQLTLPRTILYDRIRVRARSMFASGWLDEVEHIVTEYGTTELPAFQAIGYRQIVRHLAGEIDLDEALEAVIRETQRYAKRQETWFRRLDLHRFQADSETLPAVLALAR